jgi:hypothetical protein
MTPMMDFTASGGDKVIGYDSPEDDSLAKGKVGAPNPRYSRRLSDKILIAFHHACDQSDLVIAEQLLTVLENLLTRRPMSPDPSRRRSMETLVAAYERLWHLRHNTDLPR